MVYVLGVGNKLLGDDGLGVRAVEALRERVLPEDVELIDVGVGIARMLPELVHADKIVIIDAIKAGGRPGSVYRFEGAPAGGSVERSVHELQFEEIVAQLALLGCHPEVKCYGMEPKNIDYTLELSEEIAERLPFLVDSVYREIFAGGSARA